MVVIISVNSMGEEYRDAHFCETEIASLSYRCGGIVCMVIEPCCYRRVVSSTGEQCSPLQICCHEFCVLAVFYSIFKLRTRCRKCFSVRSETSPRPHLFTLTECFLMHCYLAGYSIWDNTLILIPKKGRFVA